MSPSMKRGLRSLADGIGSAVGKAVLVTSVGLLFGYGATIGFILALRVAL